MIKYLFSQIINRIKSKKTAILIAIIVILGLVVFSLVYYFRPYIITGRVVNYISGESLGGVKVSFNEEGAHTSIQGNFTIKTRSKLDEVNNKMFFNRQEYIPKEFSFSFFPSVFNHKIDLKDIALVPEGKVVFIDEVNQMRNIFTSNFDGSDRKTLLDDPKEMENYDIKISPRYDKLVFKAQDPRNLKDAFFYSINADGSNKELIGYQVIDVTLRDFKFSQNGFLAWISSITASGPYGRVASEGVHSVNREFKEVLNYKISPDGRYVAVAGVSLKNKQILVVEDIRQQKTILEVENFYQFFFDDKNFYYNSLDYQNKFTWIVYCLQDGKINKLTTEPAYWENKLGGILNPYSLDKMVILKPGWSISITDRDGLNEKKIVDLEVTNGYVSDLMWASGGQYVLFKIHRRNENILSDKIYKESLWILDINSGVYKKVFEESEETKPQKQLTGEFSDWNNYKSSGYGFEISYPKDWTPARNILGAFDIYKNFSNYNCSLEIYVNKGSYLYPITENEKYFQPFSESKISTKQEGVFVGGAFAGNSPAIKITSPDLAGREIYFLKRSIEDKVYYMNIFLDVTSLEYNRDVIINNNSCKDVFNKILSTLKFTENVYAKDLIDEPICKYRKAKFEARFYDFQGRVAGLVNNKIKEEIPGSYCTYNPESNMTEISLLADTEISRVEVFGIENGNYIFDLISPSKLIDIEFEATDIPITSGVLHHYEFDWDALAENKEGVAILIDTNSDGIFEKTVTSDNSLTCEEFIIQLKES